MSIRTVVSCDICKIDQSTVNHWFAVWIDKANKFCSVSIAVKNKPKSCKHVCGTEHAQTFYQRYMSHGTLEVMTKTEDKLSL